MLFYKSIFLYLCCERFSIFLNVGTGVCTALGEHFNISISRIRMWFIYISFLTFGSPIIIYFIMAFSVNIKNYILSAKRNTSYIVIILSF